MPRWHKIPDTFASPNHPIVWLKKVPYLELCSLLRDLFVCLLTANTVLGLQGQFFNWNIQAFILAMKTLFYCLLCKIKIWCAKLEKGLTSCAIKWKQRRSKSMYASVVCLFELRFYGPVNPMGSCQMWSVYLTSFLLDRLSPLSG